MRLTKKKIVAVSTALVLLGGLLAGCGKGDSGSKSAAGVDQPLELTWMRFEHPSQAILTNSKVVRVIEEKQNIKLKMQSVPQSNYDDKKKTLIATDTIPDILLVKQDDIQNFADSGIFLELTPYLDRMPNFSKVLEEHPDALKNKVDDKLYGFPLLTRWDFQSGQIPMIRMDILEELKLAVPTTYDELSQALKKMKAAYPASYPFASRAANGLTGTENLVNPIAFGFGSGYTTSTGTKVYYDPADKQYKFGPYSQEFKDALTWLNDLYVNKILDPDYSTATSQIWQEKLNSGKAFYFQDNNGFASGFNPLLQKDKPNAKFDMVPTLSSSNGVKRNLLYSLDHAGESYVISAKVKNPEKVIAFIDWLYSEEGTDLTSFGVENEDYKMENGQFQLTEETMNKYLDKPVPFYAMQSDLGTGYLGLALHNDAHPNDAFQTEDMKQWSERNLQAFEEGVNFRFVNDPPFNQAEREQLKILRTKLDAYMTQNMDKFIMTKGALQDWDSFVEESKKRGADELVKIYNDALARVSK
jgi:putative aldouronate transport system substrate-binding protein